MNQEEKMNDILEIVTFMKDNMVTQTEFKELKVDVAEIKTRLQKVEQSLIDLSNRLQKVEHDVITLKLDAAVLKSETRKMGYSIEEIKNKVVGHVDGFVNLHKISESEVASLAMEQDRQRDQIKIIAKHLKLDLA